MRETNRRAGEMLANLGVNIHPDTLVESLTIAQQQMVEIVKAVSFDGRIIVMDEPTSSLSNDEVEQLFGIIERLKAKQVSIIYISHRMEELFRISDRVTIIRDGAYVGTKKTSETNANELVAMMVGRELESFYARDYNDLGHAETALEVKNLTCEGVFSDISFRVRKGEILGFAGLVEFDLKRDHGMYLWSQKIPERNHSFKWKGSPLHDTDPGNQGGHRTGAGGSEKTGTCPWQYGRF